MHKLNNALNNFAKEICTETKIIKLKGGKKKEGIISKSILVYSWQGKKTKQK